MTRSVLIVDDSLTVRMDLQEAFEAAGFDTHVCTKLAEARASVARARPVLAILDVMLPDGDGVDLLREWRSDPGLAQMPIILLSAETEVADRIRGLAQGANEYVGKPYDARYVVARAHELLRVEVEARDAARTVLLIDDSRTYREQLGEALREAGYRSLFAPDGEAGLRRAAELRPHVIVVDGIMPGIDGTTVIRRLRSDPGLQSIPCLMLTGSDEASNEVTALDAGADAYARKTEGNEVVLARIAAMLRARADAGDREIAGTLEGPKRVLAVDDSLSYLELLAKHLQEDGYEVVKGRSGEQALELLEVERVDCILLDMVMPGLSGQETCRRIKERDSLRAVPVIILTSLDDAAAMIEGINAGADDYVTKSPSFDVLKARLRAQLRRKQFEDENRRVRDQILRREAEARTARELAEARAALLDELEHKNAELQTVNHELQMFAYSVSHDLRQPLRAMDGFSKVLLEDYADSLDESGTHYLERIRAGAQRMGRLIDGLLVLSRVTRKALAMESVDLAVIARAVVERLRDAEPGRSVEFAVEDVLPAHADRQLIESVLENLLGNAWKFTSKRENGRLEVGAVAGARPTTFFVRDNGVGFDMAHADNLFGPFQRLHPEREFPGTGIGLATVQRIVHRHGGRIWAESAPEEGATFYLTLEAAAPGAQDS